MTEQKDVMQLIGAWGYNARSFKKYSESQLKVALDAGDPIGATVYKSLLALATYASTADEKLSVGVGDAIRPEEEMEEIVGREIFEAIKESMSHEEFSRGVIDSLYGNCDGCATIHDAEMKLRRDVFVTVIPFIIGGIQKNATEISSHLLQMLIGLEQAMTEGDSEARAFAIKTSFGFREIVDRTLDVIDKIRMCKETPNEDLNAITDHIIGDVVTMIKDISRDILSIIDKPPHEWTDYAVSFGRFLVSFQIATSLGYIDYDTYNHIFEDIKNIKKESENPKPFFGSN